MAALLLLFLTLPAAFAVKCPDDFIHVKRVPTTKNNHTKDWCLGAFAFDNMGNRDRARSFCISQKAMLSIPESKSEYDVLMKEVERKKIAEPYAIDGEINSRCKAHIFRLNEQNVKYNTTTMKGDCNVKKNLFVFDDINSNPEFVLTHFMFTIPNRMSSSQTLGGPMFRKINECVQMQSSFDTYFDTKHCGGRLTNGTDYDQMEESRIDAVICGRHPL